MTEEQEAGIDCRHRLEEFVLREARLMDDNRYEEWLALWDEDALYWIPATQDEVDPGHEISLVYERRDKIEDRVARLRSRFAHAQAPKSRVMRLVSNFQLESHVGGLIVGTSAFVLGEIRNDRQLSYFGRARHVLAESADGSLRMREKKVLLLNNNATTGNMTFLI